MHIRWFVKNIFAFGYSSHPHPRSLLAHSVLVYNPLVSHLQTWPAGNHRPVFPPLSVRVRVPSLPQVSHYARYEPPSHCWVCFAAYRFYCSSGSRGAISSAPTHPFLPLSFLSPSLSPRNCGPDSDLRPPPNLHQHNGLTTLCLDKLLYSNDLV